MEKIEKTMKKINEKQEIRLIDHTTEELLKEALQRVCENLVKNKHSKETIELKFLFELSGEAIIFTPIVGHKSSHGVSMKLPQRVIYIDKNGEMTSRDPQDMFNEEDN